MTALKKALAQLGPEEQLVIACARVVVDQGAIDRINELLSRALDWEMLVQRADRHRVLALVSRNLQRYAAASLPPAVIARLRAESQIIAHRNLFLTHELLNVLGLLDRHGIRAFPFKGPSLAAHIYGDLSLRQFGDLDVWIRPEDFLRARDLVMAAGYVPYKPPPDETLPTFTVLQHEYGFMRGDDMVHLELLWRIVERPFAFPRDIEQIWGGLETRTLCGKPAQAIPFDMLLISLCVHGSKHLWERLGWVCDVAETVRAWPDPDWGRLLTTARALGAERMLLLGLSLAHTIVDAPVPAHILRRCAADREVARLEVVVGAILSSPNGMPDEIFNTLHLYHMRMLSRLRDRLRVVQRYSYSFLNPVHVYRKYGLGPLRHLLGDRR